MSGGCQSPEFSAMILGGFTSPRAILSHYRFFTLRVRALTVWMDSRRLRQCFLGSGTIRHGSGSARVRHHVSQFDVRWQSLVVVALTCSWLFAAPVRSEDNRPAVTSSRQGCEFVSPGQFLLEQVLAAAGSRAEQLVVGRSVDLPHRPRASRTFGPLRQMELVGGDRISAEVVHWGDDSVTLRLTGGQTISLPTTAVETLSIPPGETELLTERFESHESLSGFIDETVRSDVTLSHIDAASGERALKLAPDSRPLVVACPGELTAARVQFWFRAERASSAAIGGRMTFLFGESSDASSLTVELDGSRLAVVNRQGLTARWTTQTVELRSGWHCLTTVLSPQRVLCLVDENLLAAGSGIEAPLRAIRFAPRGEMWIDDLLISRLNEREFPLVRRLSQVDDAVASHTGEELFGRVTRIMPQGITLDGIAGEATVPWSRVAAVGFRSAGRPLSGPAVPSEGVVARIESQSHVDRPQLLADRLTATIMGADRHGLLVSHPLLGKIPFSWRDIRRIEPLFVGRDLVLDARRVHLGDSIRADFRRPLPDDTEWRSEFVLTAKPRGDVWLSLNVADLEPRGPETPPGSAYLKELHAGRLLTEVIVNDQPVGDLNRRLRFRASPDQPERLRCQLPRESLRAGANTVRLRQRPLTENGSDYDDCELSDLRLELRMPAWGRFVICP